MAREYIEKLDTLNDGREKLNRSIDKSYDADQKSDEAITDSHEAKTTAKSVREELNQVVIEGDSSVEAAQARVDTNGESHQTLKTRIDAQQFVVSKIAPVNTNFWFEDRGDKRDKGEINLVILKDSFEGSWVLVNATYPNYHQADTTVHNDTMRELIAVESGEQLALSKDTVNNDNFWRINFYGNDNTYISRRASEDNQLVLTVPDGSTKMWVSYPQGSKPQIVRGTEFIPYRPNSIDTVRFETL